MRDLKKLIEDAEMQADVKAYDAAKVRLENGEDELTPLEVIERQLKRETTPSAWPGPRKRGKSLG